MGTKADWPQSHREKIEAGCRMGFWKGIGDGDAPSFPFGGWGFFDGNIADREFF
jgi:hypothetical protein